MNPNLNVHNVHKIDKYLNKKRVVFTRFRLSSHNLKTEKGRWSRTNRENSVCDCGPKVQDETHLLFDCHKTIDLRNSHNVNHDIVFTRYCARALIKL